MTDRERLLYNTLKTTLLYLCGNGCKEAEEYMIRMIQDVLEKVESKTDSTS